MKGFFHVCAQMSSYIPSSYIAFCRTKQKSHEQIRDMQIKHVYELDKSIYRAFHGFGQAKFADDGLIRAVVLNLFEIAAH